MYLIPVKPEAVFQALADPTRIRVMRLLVSAGEECCLCELVDSLLEPQYKLSKHVKILKQVGLIDTQKEGRFIYHRLVTESEYVKRLCDSLQALPDPHRIFKKDLQRFRERMHLREEGRCRIGITTPDLATGSD